MSTRRKLVATVRTETSAHGGTRYKHAELTIHNVSERGSAVALLTVKWQSDNERPGWYGARLSLEFGQYDGSIEDLLAQANRLVRANPIGNDPGHWLASTGLGVAVHDRRFGRLIPLAEVFGSDYHRYMARNAEGYCIASAVCMEYSAEREITRDFAREIERSHKSAELLADWIARGKPFDRDNRAEAPTIPDVAAWGTPLVAVAPETVAEANGASRECLA